jgi:hypothetical protein
MHPLLLASLLLASPPGLSSSKLSLHLIAHYTPGARQVVRAGPRVLKILDLGPEMLAAAREYKRLYPQGLVALRVYTQKSYAADADPVASARDYWSSALWPPLGRLSPEDRRLIDFLEGPNECEAYPAWESPERAAWFARFWETLAPLMAEAGFRPCVGSIPVGNPPGTPEEIEARFVAFAPALRAAKRLRGAWSYHGYSLKYTTDVGEERWLSLRYRMLHEILQRRCPDVADVPVILTEAGIDKLGNPQQDGWQARGTREQFEAWLTWFDARLQEDPYVLGATLFQSGDARGWPSFDTEPVNGWLARHLRRE